MIDIVIADDHGLFLEGVVTLLSKENEINIVATASDGLEVMEILKTKNCDVLLLDIDMPGQDGTTTAKQVSELYPDVKVLMLTMHDKMIIVEKLVETGISGYILKDVSRSELVLAIEKVARGEQHYSTKITRKMVERLKKEANKELSLTKREREVLELIAKGYKSSEIAEELFVSTHTVDTHRKNLLSKARVKNSIDLVNWARENEYVI